MVLYKFVTKKRVLFFPACKCTRFPKKTTVTSWNALDCIHRLRCRSTGSKITRFTVCQTLHKANSPNNNHIKFSRCWVCLSFMHKKSLCARTWMKIIKKTPKSFYQSSKIRMNGAWHACLPGWTTSLVPSWGASHGALAHHCCWLWEGRQCLATPATS